MGPLTFGKKEEQIFLGREIAQHQDYSEDTALKIDQEVKRFVTDNYERAHGAPRASTRTRCSKMADALLAREVLDADQVRRLAAGLPLDEPQPVAPRAPRSRRRRSARRAEGAAADRAAAATSRCRRNSGAVASRSRSHSERSHCRLATRDCDLPCSLPAARFTVPLAARRRARARRAHAGHGHPQRHARFLRRRRPRARSGERPSTPALQMEADGADIIDVGGESTRPGAAPVSARRGAARASLPVLERARRRGCASRSRSTPTRPTVARAALGRGRGDRQRRQRPAVRSGAGRRRRRGAAPRSS